MDDTGKEDEKRHCPPHATLPGHSNRTRFDRSQNPGNDCLCRLRAQVRASLCGYIPGPKKAAMTKNKGAEVLR